MRARYRLRTTIRVHLPFRLIWLAPKGSDCRAHEWYNADGTIDACYHCKRVRPREVAP